jgi:hypothetical protein
MMPFLSRPTVATFSPLGEKRVHVTKREWSVKLFLNLLAGTTRTHTMLTMRRCRGPPHKRRRGGGEWWDGMGWDGCVLEGGTLEPAGREVLAAGDDAVGTRGLVCDHKRVRTR